MKSQELFRITLTDMKTGIRRNGYLCSPSRIIIAFFLTFVVVIYLTFPYEPTALRQVPYNV